MTDSASSDIEVLEASDAEQLINNLTFIQRIQRGDYNSQLRKILIGMTVVLCAAAMVTAIVLTHGVGFAFVAAGTAKGITALSAAHVGTHVTASLGASKASLFASTAAIQMKQHFFHVIFPLLPPAILAVLGISCVAVTAKTSCLEKSKKLTPAAPMQP